METSAHTAIYPTLQWQVTNRIGILTLDQPPANAMTAGFFKDLNTLRTNEISKAQVKAIIISGTGRHFSSGADLTELTTIIKKESVTSKDGSVTHFPESIGKHLEAMQFFDKLSVPAIAAIRGVCLGSGLELALYCHFRLATPKTVLSLPEASYNLIPGLGGIQHLLSLTSRMNAMDLAFKGNSIGADEGFNIGLIDRIVQKDRLTEAAIVLADIATDNYRRYLKQDYLRRFDEYYIAKNKLHQ